MLSDFRPRVFPFRILFTSLFVAVSCSQVAAVPEEGTHRQSAILKPMRGTQKLGLVTFVVAPNGQLTAAVRDYSGSKPSSALQVYTPERTLLREIPLPVMPTALARFGDEGYLVAGEGKILHISEEGKILKERKVLELLGISEAQLRAEALEFAKKEAEQMRVQATRTIADLEESIRKMEAIPSPTERQKARLVSAKKMLESQRKETQQERSLESMLDYLVPSRTYSPSLSSEGDAVILTLEKFRGYEVLKLDRNLDNPKTILGDLRGCCGQMDVIASGGRIFTAENTKFEVGVYDLEGKKLSSFGQRFKEGNQGFGSCCNPMNVLRYENGDLLTAESSIGTLKRFSAEGKLLGVVGRARIGEGCKHVAVGFDPQRDRYYVQYQDRNHICVLLPNAEAEPFVAEQNRQIAAAEKVMAGFAGKWTLVPRPGPRTWEELGLNRAVTMEEVESVKVNNMQSLEIKTDHSLSVRRCVSSEAGEDPHKEFFMRWVVTGAQGEAATVEFEEEDGVVSWVGTLRRKAETSLELKVGKSTWILNRE